MNFRTIFCFVEMVKTSKPHFLYFRFSVSPPPNKLKLTLAGKVKETQPRGGTYILGDDLVNGFPHWLNTESSSMYTTATPFSQAIWFDKITSRWYVGDKTDLGDGIGGIQGPKYNDSYPHEIKQGWRYAHTSWQDAGLNDVIFITIGTFFNPLLL